MILGDSRQHTDFEERYNELEKFVKEEAVKLANKKAELPESKDLPELSEQVASK